jgi:hypothetical protein
MRNKTKTGVKMKNNKEWIVKDGKFNKENLNKMILAEIKKDMKRNGKTISDEKWEEFVKKVEAL